MPTTSATRSRSTRRTVACAVVCLLTVVALATMDAGHPDVRTPLSPVRAALATVLDRPLAAGTRAAGAVTGYAQTVARPARTQAELDRLRRDNARLREQAAAAGDTTAVTRQVRDLLARTRAHGVAVTPARVIAFGAGGGFHRTITLDRGRDDGVRAGAAVLTGAGLAGRVLAVQPRTSTVLLLCDTASAVGVRLADGTLGLARGDGDCGGEVTVSLLAADPSVREGAPVVTSATTGGTLPAGLPVGRVRADGADPGRGRVSVALAAAPARLDVVGVVTR